MPTSWYIGLHFYFAIEEKYNWITFFQAHEDRIKDMNDQADSLIESGQFDAAAIQVY